LIEKYGKCAKKLLLYRGMTITITGLVMKINGCQTFDGASSVALWAMEGKQDKGQTKSA